MAFLQWRRFNFFEKDVVKDPETSQVYEKLKDIKVTCTKSGRGQILLGDSEGNVYFLNRQFQLQSFKAYEQKVTYIEQLRLNPILVTVGDDEPGDTSIIKVWNTEKADRMGKPLCIRNIRPQGIAFPITSITVHENMNLLASGFSDGSVLLARGDITRERQSKQKVFKVSNNPLTGLAFRTHGKQTFMFAATNDEIYSFNLSVKDKETKTLLDNHGCPPKCSILSDAKQDHQFVIGRQDAVYFYQHDGRGPCLAFDGEKILLYWFRSYLVVVGKDSKAVHSSAITSSPVHMNIVTVYDIQNKFIAYSAPLPAVVDVISEWGSLYILSQDGKLYTLQEKDTQSKLDMLFKKNQYALLISLAKSQMYDEDGLIDIFRQYGDHLYSKGDHDGAITQYIKTIGKLEASYVIRKFLDAQRIHNLTAYLQALHKKDLATEDHTTLLLNCYTKLKDISKLDEFIMTKDREIHFDVETAMKVCRQAGYYKHALFLAEHHDQHDWYLKILLEDLKDYDKALKYISKLDFEAAEGNMKTYGKVLMTEVPEQTTQLLKRLCTDYNAYATTPDRSMSANPEEFIHIFVNNSERLLEFLEHMIKIRPTSSSLVYNTYLELCLKAYSKETDPAAKKKQELKIMEMLKNSDASYSINQALVLCQMSDFKPGILHLYEKAKLYQQIIFYHIENRDFEAIMRTCELFGNYDPNLWVQALWFFCQEEKSQKPYVMTILSEIERNNLLSPILVVDIMAKSHTATLDLIKDYIIRYLQKENEQISEDERLIKQYREETEKMRNQMEELKTNPKIFQVSKCSGCAHQLELPSVHFLCSHSYHQQCFESYSAEHDSECPLCLSENQKVLGIIRSQEQNKDIHEQFHNQLERADDGFAVVADYFGRGVFNKVTIVTNSSQPSVRNTDILNPFYSDM
ncbi:vacuolar protein sorting-associated protein 11 homolog [Parasteatoda tepidariorum]|uniref:vacuolar protein sorting-associated protein 11 homolog n=1 Tax=Parasteatoda tepidariorum TaxID=114398 RepID=UPI001C71B2F8|nr:vacuolar protein sorting-associated protein 11 homolog [Parasteatoda tepidariorum]